MKNIIWANKDGNVRMTVFSPEYEGDTKEYAEQIKHQNEGYEAVLFDVDVNGCGASDLEYKDGALVQKQLTDVGE